MDKCIRKLLVVAMLATASSQAQTPPATPALQGGARTAAAGVVRGTVKDDTGGVIPGATISLTDASGKALTTTTQADGTYVFRGVAPGTYSIVATYTNLQQKTPLAVAVAPGKPAAGDIVMTVQENKQEVTVSGSSDNQVSVEASNNSSQLVLKQEDLDALPDDPDDLEADLQALAGPSAGPGGSQIYIDGFTGGRLPPKASIREIRINSNPFSAEFDKLGFGRIQIFTKPGTDKFHGQGYYNISDSVWNSRNPFLSVDPPFRTQLFGGNVSGPLGKKASFFVDVERRNIDDNGIINANIPSANFLGSQAYQNYFSTPQRRTTVSPRVDWQLGTNNTLSFRYSYLDNEHQVTNIGAFNLPQLTVGNQTLSSNGASSSNIEQSAQIVETAVLNTHVVNETHFEFDHTRENERSFSTLPELNVSQSFVAGGSGYSAAGYPSSYDLQNYVELQNYTSVNWGAHTTKFGARVRTSIVDDSSPQNFNGEYAFLGGTFPVLGSGFVNTGNTATLTSIQQYLMTEQLFAAGLNSTQISALGYGPSKFTINQGNPYLGFYQVDVGPFVNDDWRVRPNLTVSLGLRYEAQNNIYDHSDWAPRVGIAWSPGGAGGKGLNSRPKTVIRAGWGIFYDRFSETNVLSAYRYGRNGTQQVYTIDNPTVYNAAFSTTPPQSELALLNGQQAYQIDHSLRAPELLQTVIGIDRQITKSTTLSLNITNSRGVHELLTDDINSPVPVDGFLPPGTPVTVGGPRLTTNSNSVGLRPFGNVGDIYDYQSTGIFKQTQIIVNGRGAAGKWLTLFGHYVYSQAHSDTDGLTTVPTNPYNISSNWGRSSLDIHNQLFLGGSFAGPWGLRLSPFLIAHTGTPFNITTGTDLFLQGQVTPTSRPEVYNQPFENSVFNSRLGLYVNPYPVVGSPLIQRNYGTGPGFIGLNLRLSKTFGFGSTHFEGPSGGARAGGGGGYGGGGGGGHRGGGGGPGGGGGGPFGAGESTEHRYNLTASFNARNILNHENLNTPNGALTSPYFYESTGITGGFGAEATASNQRRLDVQLRFSF